MKKYRYATYHILHKIWTIHNDIPWQSEYYITHDFGDENRPPFFDDRLFLTYRRIVKLKTFTKYEIAEVLSECIMDAIAFKKIFMDPSNLYYDAASAIHDLIKKYKKEEGYTVYRLTHG